MPKLGKTKIEVPKVIMGAWALGGWFWGGSNDKTAVDTIHASLQCGINAFDTAPVYGCGHSEKVLGQALKGRREKALVFTKVGLRWNHDEGSLFFKMAPSDGGYKVYRNLRPRSIVEEVEQSLIRLQTDYIDLLQCHWPDPSFPIPKTMEALAKLYRDGKIRAIGVSNFDVDQLESAKKSLGDIPLASTQPRYSLLNRVIESDVIPWLESNDVGAIAYSPIERGLLSGKVPASRIFPDNDGRAKDPLFTAKNRTDILHSLEMVSHIAEQHECTFAQLATAWCFHQSGITAAIVGARTPQQAMENAAATEIKLSLEEQHLLRDQFATLNCAKLP